MSVAIEDMTKEELLLEFRAVRNTLKNLDERKDNIIKVVCNKFGDDKQRFAGALNTDATIFELLLS